MSKALSNSFILAVACVGIVVTLILTVMHFQPGVNIGCAAGPAGCHGVLDSQYGRVGPIPTSLVGFGMYALFIALALHRRRLLNSRREEERARVAAYASQTDETEDGFAGNKEPVTPIASSLPRQIRLIDTAIWGIALFGFATSWWLQYTAFFVLESFCVWCFTSALLVSLIFLLASRDYLLDGRPMNGEQKLLTGVSGFILVLMILMYMPNLYMQWIINNRPRGPVGGQFDREALLDKNMHLKGDPKAEVIAVEFADYMCPACKDASKLTAAYLERFPGKFRLAFRHFPLPKADHRWSKDAARAAEAAARQKKFWEMHQYIFDHQDELKEPDFTAAMFDEYARTLGLDVEKFKKDMADPTIAEKIERDIEAGKRVQITMTPTFFLMNRTLAPFPVEGQLDFKKILDDPKHPLWQQGSTEAPRQGGPAPPPPGAEIPAGHSAGDGHNH